MLAHSKKVLALSVLLCSCAAFAQDWDTVDYITHNEYQAVNSNGSPAYNGTFPIKLVGVVLNNSQDWLDPTAAYDDDGYSKFQLGGQAEFYVQAVNLDGTAYDTNTSAGYSDQGGTACWMGQNYGNHPMNADPSFNYTNSEWYAELDRLGIWHDGSTLTSNELVQAGDLVEIRARGGLNYNGKYNVNEEHSNDSAYDFEIVILEKSYGLPDATTIELSDVKDAEDAAIFDETRTTGGELYQSTLVKLTNVRFTDTTAWGVGGEFIVTDDQGRTLSVDIGLDEAFDSMAINTTTYYNLTGIFDNNGDYGMIITDAASIVAVPEPISLTACGLGLFAIILRRKNNSSNNE